MLRFPPMPRIQRILTYTLGGVLLLTIAAWQQKGTFADHRRMLPPLLEEPVQGATDREEFSFAYKGETYLVRPVAEYTIAGLVVSHNNPTAFYDIYHDRKSVDTRDLALIWGDNLRSNDFHRVDFKNISFMVQWRVPRDVTFDAWSISNNHLITDSDEVRARIGRVRVGDQVRLDGLLVDYASATHPDWYRTTSREREDDGAGACEVIFVEDLEILRRGNPVVYLVYDLGRLLVVLLVLAKVVLFLHPILSSSGERRKPGFNPGTVPRGSAPGPASFFDVSPSDDTPRGEPPAAVDERIQPPPWSDDA